MGIQFSRIVSKCRSCFYYIVICLYFIFVAQAGQFFKYLSTAFRTLIRGWIVFATLLIHVSENGILKGSWASELHILSADRLLIVCAPKPWQTFGDFFLSLTDKSNYILLHYTSFSVYSLYGQAYLFSGI